MTSSSAAAAPNQRIAAALARLDVQALLVIVLTFAVVLQTTAPTIYYLADSTEYALGGRTLGIVHAPGYALYTMVAHLFTYLPLGDVGYRVNLLSTLTHALATGFTFAMLARLLNDRLAALGAALTLAWSFRIWVNGVAAEVYMPQLAALAACGWALVAMYRDGDTSWRRVLLVGGLFGLAVALNPTSALLGPGLAVAMLLVRVPMPRNVAAAALAVGVVLVTLVYFPVRYSADPVYNVAGIYEADGVLYPVDLTTADGMWWLLSGKQFDSLFFAEGYIPTFGQLRDVAVVFWGNYIAFGLILAVLGFGLMFQKNRWLLLAWFVFWLPYTYFFTTYGADDRDTMLSPSLWLMSIPIAYSLAWFGEGTNRAVRVMIALLLPAAMLIVNYRIVDASDTYYMRERAVFLAENMPEDAIVFASWIDATMMQYMQHVEGRRGDLHPVNLYYYDTNKWLQYIESLPADYERPLILLDELSDGTQADVEALYTLSPLALDDETVTELEIDPVPLVMQRR